MKVLAKEVLLLKKYTKPNAKGIPYLTAVWADKQGESLQTSTKCVQMLDDVEILTGVYDVTIAILQGKSDKGYWTVFGLDDVKPVAKPNK